MYKCEREDEIMALLSKCEYATVDYLVQRINISASSIRRDLKNLEERGLVVRSYGGVKLANPGRAQVPFSLRTHENSDRKKQMARAALQLIHPGDTLFLDASSSVYFLAELLPTVGGLTVITNSIDILTLLSGYDIKLYSTGGVVSADNRAALTGPYAEAFLEGVHANIAFFSVRSVEKDGTFSDCYSEEVAIRRVMMKRADQTAILCDSGKWGRNSTFRQTSMDEIQYLITDRDPNHFFEDPTPGKYIIG